MVNVIKKATIITGYRCNCQCKFCMNLGVRNFYKSTQEIIADIVSSKKEGKTHLSFFGGENSIRPDIVYLIKYAKKLGFKEIVMGTNGRMFAYKEFAREVVEAGLTELYFSIHGHNEEVHDSLTQVSGSFAQLVKGVENIKSFGLKRFGSHTTIVKPNYKFLPQIGELIFNFGIRSAEFLYVNPSLGGAHSDFNDLIPRISDAAPYIRSCLDIGRKNDISDWAVSHVPMCHFVGYEKQVNQPDTRRTKNGLSRIESRYIFDSGLTTAKDTTHVSIKERAKTKRCNGCRYENACLGMWKEYIKHFGDSELIPVKDRP